jgi:hypothetical protein
VSQGFQRVVAAEVAPKTDRLSKQKWRVPIAIKVPRSQNVLRPKLRIARDDGHRVAGMQGCKEERIDEPAVVRDAALHKGCVPQKGSQSVHPFDLISL